MSKRIEIHRKLGSEVYEIERWGLDIGIFNGPRWNPHSGKFATEFDARQEFEEVVKINPETSYRIVKVMPDLPRDEGATDRASK